MKNKLLLFPIFSLFIFVITGTGITNAQTQRNPVLEFCTGTWCQWCPCGDQVIEEDILPAIPNAIILAYHGAGSDPFRIFPGSGIIGSLGLSAYPTGVIDRTSGVQSRGAWLGLMNNRTNVPATVSISIEKSYNQTTRELTAAIDFTALENLNGQYSYNIILVEDGIVYGQTSNNTCTPGITYIADYVHYWLVRDMINGVSGEEIVNGVWNQGEVITKNVLHTFTVPPAPAPDIVPDSCGIVVFVYKNGTPLNSGAEIQQAEQWTLISPNYVATINTYNSDAIADNSTPVQFTTTLKNEGLLNDVYYIDPVLDGPSGWTGEFTTENGTFPFGEMDSVSVSADDSTTIEVTIIPNGIDGYGETQVVFTSQSDPGITGSVLLRNVTTTGVDILVVDDSGENYGDAVRTSLDNLSETSYGIVSSTVINSSIDLSDFNIIFWSMGEAIPVFNQEEVTSLQNYLDQGGSLFINGQDIGSDIFETTGQSQFAQSFYNNYLHASYEANAGGSFLLKGYDGDPISDGLLFVIGDLYDRSADAISPFDADATPIFYFLNTEDISSLRVSTETYRVVYLGIGFEQVSTSAARDSLVARSIRWLTPPVGIDNESNKPISFSLAQNYPNPFNPATSITYSVREESPVTIKVFDMIGQEVATLVNDVKKAGTYSVNFNADKLSSGVYIYQMKAGSFISAKKMSILK